MFPSFLAPKLTPRTLGTSGDIFGKIRPMAKIFVTQNSLIFQISNWRSTSSVASCGRYVNLASQSPLALLSCLIERLPSQFAPGGMLPIVRGVTTKPARQRSLRGALARSQTTRQRSWVDSSSLIRHCGCLLLQPNGQNPLFTTLSIATTSFHIGPTKFQL